MYRPLNWLVVVLSVSVLCANLWLVKPDPALDLIAAGPSPHAIPAGGRSVVHSPFAYIHEDGSEQYLPAIPAGDWQSLDAGEIVYSWSAEDQDLVSAAVVDALNRTAGNTRQ